MCVVQLLPERLIFIHHTHTHAQMDRTTPAADADAHTTISGATDRVCDVDSELVWVVVGTLPLIQRHGSSASTHHYSTTAPQNPALWLVRISRWFINKHRFIWTRSLWYRIVSIATDMLGEFVHGEGKADILQTF